MATAYTPGLAVTRQTRIRKLRRLPLAGEVLATVGQVTQPLDVLARAELPGIMRTVRAAETLGVDPKDLEQFLLVKEGDSVEKGAVICRSTSFFGLFKSECRSPVSGLVELINPISGTVGIREAPSPVEVTAYLRGTVTEVLAGEGAYIETEGALIQGIFGVGGERTGPVRIISERPDMAVTAESIPSDAVGKVLVGGASADLAAIRAAADAGAAGLVVGGVVDEDLVAYLGYDIGVAITGQEQVPTTLIITEGFGSLPMAHRTWDLFRSGRASSLHQRTTQIRAGVIRPEVIVPGEQSAQTPVQAGGAALDAGSPIRLIREPYFGMLGEVVELPSELHQVPSGASVRVLVARLSDGRIVTTPRANVELIEQ